MHRYLVLGLFALVAACANQQQTNMKALLAVEATYGTALSAAVNYGKLPLCAPGASITMTNFCHDRGVLAAIAAADKKAQPALKAARDFVAANPTLDASSLIAAATAAVNEMTQAEAVAGVK